MKTRASVVVVLFSVVLASSVFAGPHSANKEAAPVPVVRAQDFDSMRIEGEKRFHTNCGRCHAAPQKFPPRMMATVLRHMRVRATVTEDDQRLILFYMTQ
jgi:cytochrome c5